MQEVKTERVGYKTTQIWQIADAQNRGLLTPSGFGVVMRLIGHAQAGHAPTEELALQRKPATYPMISTSDILEILVTD
jgi:epidermal growth factor receptor substrate 15